MIIRLGAFKAAMIMRKNSWNSRFSYLFDFLNPIEIPRKNHMEINLQKCEVLSFFIIINKNYLNLKIYA